MPNNAKWTGVTDVQPRGASFWDTLFAHSLRKPDRYDNLDRTLTNFRMTKHLV